MEGGPQRPRDRGADAGRGGEGCLVGRGDGLDRAQRGQQRAAAHRSDARHGLQRARERVPVAYLTGEAWLRGVRFKSDARALVPRSLIAEAIEESLDAWLPDGEPGAVLDLCTSGGSLAVLAALRWPQARVDASDVSAPERQGALAPDAPG